MLQTIQYSETPKFAKSLQGFCGKASTSADVSKVVTKILSEIRKGGDPAVLAATKRYDGATLRASAMRVKPEELEAAFQRSSYAERRAIRKSISMVKDFHKKTLPRNWEGRNAHGAIVGERFYPIQRVGLYIPGGNVPLVSTVIMTAVLAKLVKCPEIVVCTPPGPDGLIASGMLAALHLVGIEEVYKVGGVQAIGAMAYGTKTIPAVDKIYGPGNAFVMEAKRQVLGTVGIDLLPGPSEVMLIADAGADPKFLAADLLAQAEHGSGKEILYLATTSRAQLKKIEQAIEAQLPALSHGEKCAKIIKERCLVIACRNLKQAAAVANYIAPEHLELQVAEKSIAGLTQSITTAGAILQGYYTPTVVGDFTAGPSHTLPTGRAGRYFSGLQAIDFLRRSSIVRYGKENLKEAQSVVEIFADIEKLDAHGNSLKIRL